MERLKKVCAKTLNACRLLEQEAALVGRMKFDGGELQIFANDRLLAPNTDATTTALRPAIDLLLGILYPGAKCELVREMEPKERFSVIVKSGAKPSMAELLDRLK